MLAALIIVSALAASPASPPAPVPLEYVKSDPSPDPSVSALLDAATEQMYIEAELETPDDTDDFRRRSGVDTEDSDKSKKVHVHGSRCVGMSMGAKILCWFADHPLSCCDMLLVFVYPLWYFSRQALAGVFEMMTYHHEVTMKRPFKEQVESFKETDPWDIASVIIVLVFFTCAPVMTWWSCSYFLTGYTHFGRRACCAILLVQRLSKWHPCPITNMLGHAATTRSLGSTIATIMAALRMCLGSVCYFLFPLFGLDQGLGLSAAPLEVIVVQYLAHALDKGGLLPITVRMQSEEIRAYSWTDFAATVREKRIAAEAFEAAARANATAHSVSDSLEGDWIHGAQAGNMERRKKTKVPAKNTKKKKK